METIKINYGDVLICDPCYIKKVGCDYGDTFENRFDLLRCDEVLHDGDDGEFEVVYKGKTCTLGVDSGRIWAMVAEFNGTVEIDAGFSGYVLFRAKK